MVKLGFKPKPGQVQGPCAFQCTLPCLQCLNLTVELRAWSVLNPVHSDQLQTLLHPLFPLSFCIPALLFLPFFIWLSSSTPHIRMVLYRHLSGTFTDVVSCPHSKPRKQYYYCLQFIDVESGIWSDDGIALCQRGSQCLICFWKKDGPWARLLGKL